jgi:hypothetical protein
MREVSDAFLLNMAEVSAGWSAVLFAVMSLGVIAANVDTAIQIRAVHRVTGSTSPVCERSNEQLPVIVSRSRLRRHSWSAIASSTSSAPR